MSVPQGVPALGRIGIWSFELRFGDRAEALEAAAELEELGYGTLWIPGGRDDRVLEDVDRLLDATRRITIATGIINVWKNTPEEVADWFAAEAPERQQRTLLGLGVSHSPIIGEAWGKPLELMRDYLDKLDARAMPRHNLCLAALGPRMTALAGERTAGSHPYLTSPEHTAIAREILGPGKLLAPEQGVVLEADPETARDAARKAVDRYCSLPNYVNSWKRLGISQAAIDARSDEFIDAIFAWGSPERIAERIQAHFEAGADHVCVQAIPRKGEAGFAALRPVWRELAEVLL